MKKTNDTLALTLGTVLAAATLIFWNATPRALAEQGAGASAETGGVADEWPRIITALNSEIAIYQPQLDRWENEVLEARTAIAALRPQDEEPIYGAVWIQAETVTDFDTRMVTLTNIEVTEVKVPDAERTPEELKLLVQTLLPTQVPRISLDRILADLPNAEQDAPEGTKVSWASPWFYVTQAAPAALVNLTGEARLADLEGIEGVRYVSNTREVIFYESATETYWLRLADAWAASPALETGTWKTAGQTPAALAAFPADHPLAWVQETGGAVPAEALQVYVSTQPAELVVLRGEPEYAVIEGTGVAYVTNTGSDLFRVQGDPRFFLHLRGRWFAEADLVTGTWASVNPADLPENLAAIPEDHEKAHVLASIPGTRQAMESAQLAETPRKAAIDKSQATVEVDYAGEPEFEQIEETGVSYATNTAYDVVQYNGQYYCCYTGVWFRAAAAAGPWIVAETVPDAIYAIPPSSPLYHVTYVQVYESTPETVVVGYTAGYTGTYVTPYGTVVYGTGYAYPAAETVYTAYPATYGQGAVYDAFAGSYVNTTVTDYGQVTTATTQAYNSLTGVSHSGSQSYNGYAQWGQHTASYGDAYLNSGHVFTENVQAAGFQTSGGQAGGIVHGQNATAGGIKGPQGGAAFVQGDEHSAGVVKWQDDLYVGVDGEIYKHDDDGWYAYDDGDWNQVDPQESWDGSAARESGAATERQGTAAAGQAGAGESRGQQAGGESGARAGRGEAGEGQRQARAGSESESGSSRFPSQEEMRQRQNPGEARGAREGEGVRGGGEGPFARESVVPGAGGERRATSNAAAEGRSREGAPSGQREQRGAGSAGSVSAGGERVQGAGREMSRGGSLDRQLQSRQAGGERAERSQGQLRGRGATPGAGQGSRDVSRDVSRGSGAAGRDFSGPSAGGGRSSAVSGGGFSRGGSSAGRPGGSAGGSRPSGGGRSGGGRR